MGARGVWQEVSGKAPGAVWLAHTRPYAEPLAYISSWPRVELVDLAEVW